MDQNWSNTILSFMVILSRLFTCPYIKIIYILLWDGVLSLSPKACFLPDSQQFYFSFLDVSLLHSVCFSHVLSQLVLMEEGRQSKYYTAWQMRKPRLSKKWFALLTQLEDIKDREFEPKTTCLILSSQISHGLSSKRPPKLSASPVGWKAFADTCLFAVSTFLWERIIWPKN